MTDRDKIWRLAIHESGHAIVGECCGWQVRDVRINPHVGGLCRFRGSAPSELCDIATSVAGHSCEHALLGRDGDPSRLDRRFAAWGFRRCGIGRTGAIAAMRNVETEMALLVTDDDFREGVLRVARELVRKEFLNREGFLAAVGHDELAAMRPAVRRFCRRTVREEFVHQVEAQA